MLITGALVRFDVQLQADGRSRHTCSQYRRHVRALADWVAGERLSGHVEDLSHEHLARFLTSPVANTRPDGEKKKATSMNALRSSLKVFFGYLHEAGFVEVNPARMIKRAITAPPPPRALTTHEEERLLGELAKARGAEEERDAVLFRLMLGTGLRLSSALNLDVADVDLEEGILAVRMKRDRSERVFVPGAVREDLRGLIGDRSAGVLFPNQTGGRICPRHAQRRFRIWRERAALPQAVSPHALRHSFAVRLLAQTGDLVLVQRALTHASISSTVTYLRCGDERLREAIQAQARTP